MRRQKPPVAIRVRGRLRKKWALHTSKMFLALSALSRYLTRGKKAWWWLGMFCPPPRDSGTPCRVHRNVSCPLRAARSPPHSRPVTLLHTSVTFSISRHGFHQRARLEWLLVPVAREGGVSFLEIREKLPLRGFSSFSSPLIVFSICRVRFFGCAAERVSIYCLS